MKSTLKYDDSHVKMSSNYNMNGKGRIRKPVGALSANTGDIKDINYKPCGKRLRFKVSFN